MSLNDTPSSERVHIGFFGCTNVGKSSLVNAVTMQEVALVSDVSGTTTDVVKKSMELLPIGPVMIIDTPGFDDTGILGEKRVKNTKKAIETIDAAVLVCDALRGMTDADKELKAMLEDRNVPYITVFNKADTLKKRDEGLFYVSAKTGEGLNQLKETLARIMPRQSNKIRIVDSFIKKGDTVILVTPIDEAAPKGRIILPQQQVLRNLLDIGALAVVVQPKQLESAIGNLTKKPRCVITDSQVFEDVSKIVPEGILLTSFSILLAAYKGILEEAVSAVSHIARLNDGDKILIAEGCTHHRQCNDIGTVKIPAMIKKFTNAEVEFTFTSGGDFPQDLSGFALVVHCGGCTLNEREMRHRISLAREQGVPIVNYGMAIAKMTGILEKSINGIRNS